MANPVRPASRGLLVIPVRQDLPVMPARKDRQDPQAIPARQDPQVPQDPQAKLGLRDRTERSGTWLRHPRA